MKYMHDELVQDQVKSMIEQQAQQDSSPSVVQQAVSSGSTEQPKEKEGLREYNLRIMREKLEEKERRIKELEEMYNKRSEPSANQTRMQTPDETPDFSDEDLIEGKHLKKIIQKVTQQYDKKIDDIQKQSAEQSAEIRLKAQFSDFDEVITADNIKTLSTLYPEAYESMMYNPNLYAKGKAAYTLIKNLGIAHENPAVIDAEKRLSSNKNKVKSSATISPQASETPLARVGEYDRRVLTEERKEQLRRQVAEAKRFL